ncbi:hypothetical protein EV383_3649 [Pseudonocardia sediminis]|uniref:Uncharacterized protein n=1 Tax=Pseudonocardia sediminis TaxID=1397368 RepID=A0A4Q7V0C5_PSEST|nr:hypothetical protein [Pseudonocardia sediminis]RZT86751.1 hypothetical protein EV383_3649 [Pseudonocardia sediminis]
MTRVVIQPSYGLPRFRRHWTQTLDRTVAFTGLADALDGRELADLRALHPAGEAHFWGASAAHDRRMAQLGTGDVVLLTGRKQVLAVGEVGLVLRNPAFARALWNPAPDVCNWDNVYSLLALTQTRIPYERVWELPGFNPGDNFMGLRLLDDTKAAAVLSGLGITTATSGTGFAVG